MGVGRERATATTWSRGTMVSPGWLSGWCASAMVVSEGRLAFPMFPLFGAVQPKYEAETSCRSGRRHQPPGSSGGTNEVLSGRLLSAVPGLCLHPKEDVEIICQRLVDSPQKSDGIIVRLAASMFAKLGAAEGIGCGDTRVDEERDSRVSNFSIIVSHCEHHLRLFQKSDGLDQSTVPGRGATLRGSTHDRTKPDRARSR